MSNFPIWEWFMQAVEGRPGAPRMVVTNGRPARATSEPDWADASDRPNPSLLIDVLRGGEDIPPEVRNWLADLIEDNGVGELRLHLVRRQRGAPKTGGVRHWPAASYVRRRVEEDGQTRQRAIAEAMEKFGIGRSAIEEALSSLKAAEAEAALSANSE
jgi:hypothetical protein